MSGQGQYHSQPGGNARNVASSESDTIFFPSTFGSHAVPHFSVTESIFPFVQCVSLEKLVKVSYPLLCFTHSFHDHTHDNDKCSSLVVKVQLAPSTVLGCCNIMPSDMLTHKHHNSATCLYPLCSSIILI